MHTFHLPQMTCGHCASTVRLALQLVDPDCGIQVDLSRREVQVRSDEDRAVLSEALADAGYPPAAPASAGQ
jgi:copper chaperone